MNFEKDVFISYAHIDDESLTEGIKGWITEFHNSLEIRLSQILGDHPKIWRDAKLQGNDFFAPEIEAQFPKLKIMISVITPRYVKSEWCTKEVDLFIRAADNNGGISIQNKARIFKVIKTPVKLEDQPERIRPLLGYDFFQIDPETKRPREFGVHGKENEIVIQYWTKLDDVAYDVAQLIETLNAQNKNGNSSVDISLPINGQIKSKRSIFLAETSYDLKEYRDILKRELEDKGYLVLPNKQYESSAVIYKSEMSSDMNTCSLSIHLIGSSYGSIPDGEYKSIIELQNEIAAEQSKARGLNRLIWIPELKSTEDERLTSFIDQVKHKEDLQNGSDLLQGTIDEFKFSIMDTLAKLDEADKQKEADKIKANTSTTQVETAKDLTNTEPKTIYLVCDQRDMNDIKAIDDYLYNTGYNVWPSIFEGSQEELAKAHEDSLRDCDAVLIYYGNANESWLRTKISELKRKPALSNSKPLLCSIVYLAEPSNTQKASYRTRDVNAVVNGLNGFKDELLNDFIDKLK